VAQAASLAIILQDRGELLSRASGMQSAQRIADIVTLLDSLGAAERARIVAVLSAPPLRVTLAAQAPSGAPAAGAGAQAAIFSALLQRLLGADRSISVALHDNPGQSSGPYQGTPGHGPFMSHQGMGGPGMMRYFAPPALSFVASVRLADGSWANFDSRIAQDSVNWPYRVLLSVGILVTAVLLLSLFGVRWITRPLKTLADAAEELGRNIDRPPLAETGPLEVARAARALNTMQSRLSRYLHDRTRILAAMSHDLKTPITRLRLRAELLDDPVLKQKFSRDFEELEAMVVETLDFMRGLESGEASQRVDINALLESLQADVREAGGNMQIEGAALSPCEARPQALKRCLSNLIDNALKYGKLAHVAITDTADALCISIGDEGPGVPEAELEKVFEPFYRLEGSRSRESGGTGLGLSIARNIAEQHGGTLTLRNRAGGGLEARLALPRKAGQATN
jgi:signal transduction histidine kinase